MLNSYRYNFLKCLTFSGEFCNFFFSKQQQVPKSVMFDLLSKTSKHAEKKKKINRKMQENRTSGSVRLLPKPAEVTGTRGEL